MDKYIFLLLAMLLSNFTYAASFTINVPDRSASGLQPVRDVELFIGLPPANTTGNINFRISRNSGNSSQFKDFTVSYSFDGNGNGDSQTLTYSDDNGSGKLDRLTVSAETNPDDPRIRFKIYMQLETNWNQIGCTSRQSENETWTVETRATGSTSVPDITGICIKSYEAQNIMPCDPSPSPIAPTDNPATANPPFNTQISVIAPCINSMRPKPPVLRIN